MTEIKKFPRTQHIRGSRFQHGDHDLEAVPWEDLRGKWLVIEEKMDGANCGISFSEDGELLLQSRGHYLRGGPREKQFELLKQWATTHTDAMARVLSDRYIMYGEWLYAKHTFFYDALPHYFMEFDVFDKQTDTFLDTFKRSMLLRWGVTRSPKEPIVPVDSVHILGQGNYEKLSELESMIGHSRFISPSREGRLAALHGSALRAGVKSEVAEQHTDMSDLMEGLYVKWEEDGMVKGRYKYVRGSFTNAIADQEEHWHDRPIVPNLLAPGAYLKMFE